MPTNNKGDKERDLFLIQKIMNAAPWIVVGVVILTVIVTIIQVFITR